ncbi:hypothetical protein CONPUDRAFT_72239 [Coniophora puteana RWD-64-598 SS2]|uniref:Uncharacterized protein n=1 Tax=Coniophora puteana (strain RWD-64-598) TaxID=741705 RepID=A0A5M3MTJ5_CONPW|nr:uncharacterized protein CONPUDRAFT_72239 [Coniophora puteana RWD-64-598 SS2]EIW81861.1 hypothetical protein CONPUDRAFT_72239 [Coniophora puteana RWD-64-598 SS2]
MSEHQNAKLPPAALVRLFEIHLALVHTEHSDLGTTPPERDVWPLLHVCREWRHVALATPHLWRHVSLAWSPRLISLAIACSSNEEDKALLTLHCTEQPVPSPDDAKIVALSEGLSRVKGMFLVRRDISQDNALQRTLSLLGSSLETLVVVSLEPNPLQLPTLASLRRLHVKGCGIRFVDPALCPLTHLIIAGGSASKPVMTLRDIHRLHAALTVIELAGSIAMSNSNEPHHSLEQIHMSCSNPCLQRISIESDLLTSQTLFKLIDAPPTTQLHMRCSSLSPSEGPLEMDNPVLFLSLVNITSEQRWMPTPLIISVSELSLRQYRTTRGYGLVVSWGPPATSSTDQKPDLRFSVDMSSFISESSMYDTLSALVHVLPYDDFPVVHVSGFDSPSSNLQRRLWGLFSSESKMTHLSVSGCHSRGLLNAFKQGLPRAPSQQQPRSPLRLRFSNLFSRSSTSTTREPASPSYADGTFVPLLTQLLIDGSM